VPRSIVWDAMNRPELLQRWLCGPPGWSMVHCENEPAPGGAFRYVWRGGDGVEMAMHGVYREVAPPERVVRTESFEFGCDGQGGEQLAPAVLAERDGRTTLTITVLFPSKEARDATIASGMEHGMAAGYDRLEMLLAATPARGESLPARR